MSFCPNCGAQLTDDSRFCTQCGANLSSAEAQQQQYTYSYVQEPEKPKVEKSLSVQCMIFAIIALIMAEYCVSVSFIVCLPLALVFASLSKKKRNAWLDLTGEDNGFTKAGKIMSKIAIPVSIALSAIFVVYAIFYIAIVGGGLASASGGDFEEILYAFEDIFEEIFGY